MPKFRKLPVEIEAYKFIKSSLRSDWPDWLKAASTLPETTEGAFFTVQRMSGATYHIATLEGDMNVSDGDYIIKGVAAEIYPCKPEIFERTYEAME